MIYGKDCPGNHHRLRWLALKTPFFSNIDNKRSIYLTKVFKPIIKLIKLNLIKKVFGTLIYDREEPIEVSISFNDSIKKLKKNELNDTNRCFIIKK